MPKNAHNIDVGTANVPEKVRNPAIIPITMLTVIPMPAQPILHEQLFIKSPPASTYAESEILLNNTFLCKKMLT